MVALGFGHAFNQKAMPDVVDVRLFVKASKPDKMMTGEEPSPGDLARAHETLVDIVSAELVVKIRSGHPGFISDYQSLRVQSVKGGWMSYKNQLKHIVTNAQKNRKFF